MSADFRSSDGLTPNLPPATRLRRDQEDAVHRPPWVWLVTTLYCSLLLSLVGLVLFGAFVSFTDNDPQPFLTAAIPVGVMTLLGLSLLVIPIEARLGRPTPGPIWIPIVGSGACAGLLFLGLGLALGELFYLHNNEILAWMLIVAAITVWMGWTVLFAFMAGSLDPLSFNNRLYKLLIAGGVLELLVAVQAHIVVRRRAECCAGIYTTVGIMTGTAMMIVALGPGVFFLFYKRYQEKYARVRR